MEISWGRVGWGGVDTYEKNYKVRVKEPEYRNCQNRRGMKMKDWVEREVPGV